MLNIPNLLTVGRLVLLPVMVVAFFAEATYGAVAAWVCLAVYVLSAFTDFLDGWLARKLNQISAFGTFLDPIADKILVGVLFMLLIAFDRLPDFWIIPALVIMTREFLVSGLREYLGPKNIQMPVTKLAKWKTATQMMAMPFLIIGPYIEGAFMFGHLTLSLAAVLTVITGWGYLRTGLEVMRVEDGDKSV